MKKHAPITTLFTDIGGVLLTNGWDRAARKLAAKKFNLDQDELSERHHLTFDTYEEGKLTLDEYLKRTVFYVKRPFTPVQFRNFMFEQSQPYPEMIDLICRLKARNGLKIAVVSNEGRELNAYRIRHFKLNQIVDFYISSSYVHFRKPDADMYRVALDIAQAAPENVLYLEDREMFVEVAADLGIRGLHHMDYQSTMKKLVSYGLKI
jgi:putative hydrolase of the HAD superfamily